MTLIKDIFLWLIVRCWKALLIISSLFVLVATFLCARAYWRAAWNDLGALSASVAFAHDAIVEQVDLKNQALSEMKRLNNEKPWDMDPSLIPWSWKFDGWKRAYHAAESAENAAKEKWERAKTALQAARNGKWIGVTLAQEAWSKTIPLITSVLVMVFFVPLAWKITWYYGIAPLTSKAPPIRILEPGSNGLAEVSASESFQTVELNSSSPLCTRASWVNEYPADKVIKRTRFIWDKHSILISYAAGLHELSEWRAIDDCKVTLKLCCAQDPHVKIGALILDNHPGIVLRPTHIVAISGDIKLKTKWTLFSIHSWICGTLRQIVFSGTGTLYLSGHGDLHGRICEPKRRFENGDLLIGHDGRMPYRTVRTQLFWDYLKGDASLHDFEFEQAGLVICQSAETKDDMPRRRKSMTARIEALAELCLKPFGF